MSQQVSIAALIFLVGLIAVFLMIDRIAVKNPGSTTVTISQSSYPGPPFDLTAVPQTKATLGTVVTPGVPASIISSIGVIFTWKQAGYALADSFQWQYCRPSFCSAWMDISNSDITETDGVYSYTNLAVPNEPGRCASYVVKLRATASGAQLKPEHSDQWDSCDTT